MAGDGMNEEESTKDPDARASSPDETEAPEEGEPKPARRARKRARLTLRIPDDAVARPEPAAPVTHVEPAETDEASAANARTEEVPALTQDTGPIAAAPIINLGEVTGPEAAHLVRASSRPPPALVHDDEKTPLMPAVVSRASSSEDIDVAVDEEAPPSPVAARDTELALPPVEDQTGEVKAVSLSQAGDAVAAQDEEIEVEESPPSAPPPPARMKSEPPPPPRMKSEPPPRMKSEPAPVPSTKSDPPIRHASEPAPKMSDPPLKHLSDPPRAMAQAILDTEEASIESDRESSLPIDPEDMVSIESSPHGASSSQPPPHSSQPPKKPGPVPSTPRMAVAPPARAPLVIVPSHATTPSPLAPHTVTESTAQRRRGRPWWEELFNDDFVRTMAKITDDQIAGECDFIEDSLGVAKGGAVLDLACGTGRHAIELSRRGYQVVGYDLSLSMLARAADEAQDRDQKLNFVHGDMREMTFDETFDGVYCWNTSFGFFEEEKNAAVISKVHKSLRSGGQFLLDVINRDYCAQQSPSLVWFEGDACICMDEMQVDFITSRMKVKRTMMFDDGRTREIDYQIRIYSLHELGKMLHDHGFRIAEVSGNCATPGVYFGSASPRTLILAEKR
jgi:SAM-dependent methyltransferase